MTDSSENVGVFCRLKPLSDDEMEPCIKYENEYTVSTYPPAGCRRNTKKMTYSFTKVFHEDCSQDDLFNDVTFPMITDLLNGKNGLLFAYGVTGSGKTYTMQGTNECPGIIGRTIKSLFSRLNFIRRFRIRPDNQNGFKVYTVSEAMEKCALHRNDYSRRSGNHDCQEYVRQLEDDPFEIKIIENCTVFISMVEMYGNQIRDLLADTNDINADISVKRDKRENNYLHNAKEVEVQSPTEALYWFMKGQKKRKTSATNLNYQSSRSHCIFNFRLVKLDRHNSQDEYSSQSGEGITVNQLSLVDLAGSERAKRTGAFGAQLKEAGDINKSLMALKAIMEKLRDKQKPFINYRANDLTYLFKTSLNGGSNVRMIVCVQQKPDEYDETLNVLTFAEKTKEIIIHTQENFIVPKTEPVVIKVSSRPIMEDDEYTDLREIGETIKTLTSSAERYRMIRPEELSNNQEMMQTVMVLFDYSERILQTMDQLNTMKKSYEIDDNSELVDTLRMNINNEKLEKNSLKRRLKDAECRLVEKDKEMECKTAEIANLYKLKETQEDRIRNLEMKLKQKNEEFNCHIKQINFERRQSVKANPTVSVKSLAAKFDGSNVINSLPEKKVVASTTTRGFYNPQYQHHNPREKVVIKREKNEIPTGAMNTIRSKRKRSMENTTLKRLRNSQKFVLQHQTVNSNDFIVDNHIGNIIPTAGGGVAVQYTHTETVKQHSPYNNTHTRKRKSSESYDY